MAREMAIATTVEGALAFEGVAFRVLRRPVAAGAADALSACGVEPEACAQASLLKDAHGYVLTVPQSCSPLIDNYTAGKSAKAKW